MCTLARFGTPPTLLGSSILPAVTKELVKSCEGRCVFEDDESMTGNQIV